MTERAETYFSRELARARLRAAEGLRKSPTPQLREIFDAVNRAFEERKTVEEVIADGEPDYGDHMNNPPPNPTIEDAEPPFSAEQAKKLTQQNIKGPIVSQYMKPLYARIKEAATSGRTFIHDLYSPPKIGSNRDRLSYPSVEVEKAIADELRKLGYNVEYFRDPDPGHPCSSPYWKISW
jgi:hypothetical protein